MIGMQENRYEMPTKEEKKRLNEITKHNRQGYKWVKNQMLGEFSGYSNGKIIGN